MDLKNAGGNVLVTDDSLILRHVTEQQEGSYRCVAKNQVSYLVLLITIIFSVLKHEFKRDMFKKVSRMFHSAEDFIGPDFMNRRMKS